MKPIAPRLAYFEEWTDPIAGRIIDDAQPPNPEIDVHHLRVGDDVQTNWAVLRQMHGYQALIRTEAAKRPGVAEQWLPDADFIDKCPDLVAVCSAGAGYDVIDVEACTRAGILACNNSGPGAEAVAEHALGFMLALSKKIVMADRMMHRSFVADRSPLRGSELAGKTLGVVGLGQIGIRLVELCVPFHMEVLAFDPFLTAEAVEQRGARKVELDELLASSDFVHLTCPLTEETDGLIGADELASMKPTAFLTTTARGRVHDEQALVEALVTGQIAGAGVDVFHEEPPPVDHPLLALDTVIATPHVAGITVEAAREIGRATAGQWLTIFSGQVPPRLLNPSVWPLYSKRFEAIFGRRPASLPA
jgi:D-3-phosphoglycerate dehydrogenase / 2-oxoglutarate reductase